MSTSGATESTTPSIADMDTQSICVSEAKASGITLHASVLYVPPTYTQAAVHMDSQALGAPLSVANPGLGQSYYTAGVQPKIPAHVPESNAGLAVNSIGNVGLPFYSAYATPHLAPSVPAPPLMPHSAMTSPAMTPYFSTPAMPVATSVPPSNVSLLAPVAHPKAET